MAATIQLAINGTSDRSGRYVGWAPSSAELRVLDSDGAAGPIGVRLSSPDTGGGRVVFAATSPDDAQDELALTLPIDGAPVAFLVLGRYESASQADRDASIIAVTNDGTRILAEPLMVRIRKDAETLTDAERIRFISALSRLNQRGGYQVYRDVHVDGAPSDEAHSLDAFLPWHRAYLLDLERELQIIDPSVSIPYWRFDTPAPRVFNTAFMGSADPTTGSVQFAPANPLGQFATDGQLGIVRLPQFDTQTEPATNVNGPVLSERPVVTSALPYTRLRPPVESNPHGQAHTCFGGYLSRIGTAVRDPLFFLLHANVDRLWAKWQWRNHHVDLAQEATYFFRTPAGQPGSIRIGHNAPDTMWPWNNDTTGVRPRTAPRTPFPASPVVAAPGGAPKVAAMIDYQGVVSPTDRLGFDYDDVPFQP